MIANSRDDTTFPAIKAAYQNFRGSWDMSKCPELRLPIGNDGNDCATYTAHHFKTADREIIAVAGQYGDVIGIVAATPYWRRDHAKAVKCRSGHRLFR
jgi:hypothetical protein